MTRDPDTRRRRPAGRRDQIITVAGGMFHSRGFHGVALDDIAREVEVSAPALYRHFRSKNHLLAAVVDRVVGVIEVATAEVEDVESVTEALAALSVSSHHVGTLLGRELRHVEAEMRAAFDARVAGVLDRLAKAMSLENPVTARFMLAVAGSTSFYEPRTSADSTRATVQRALKTLVAAANRLPARAIRPRQQDPAVERDWLPKAEAIIAAAPTIAEHARGFHRATLEEYAAAAGITGPSIYTYFSSKAELERIVLARIERWALSTLEQSLALGTNGTDVMRRALGGYATLTAYAPGFTVPAELRDPELDSDQVAAVNDFIETFLALWQTCARASRQDLPDPELEVLVRAALAVVNETRTTTIEDAGLVNLALSVFLA